MQRICVQKKQNLCRQIGQSGVIVSYIIIVQDLFEFWVVIFKLSLLFFSIQTLLAFKERLRRRLLLVLQKLNVCDKITSPRTETSSLGFTFSTLNPPLPPNFPLPPLHDFLVIVSKKGSIIVSSFCYWKKNSI